MGRPKKPRPPRRKGGRIPGTRVWVKILVTWADGRTHFKSVWDRSGKPGEAPRLSDEEIRSWEKYRELYDFVKERYPNEELYCIAYNPPGHPRIIRWYDYLVKLSGKEFPDIRM